MTCHTPIRTADEASDLLANITRLVAILPERYQVKLLRDTADRLSCRRASDQIDAACDEIDAELDYEADTIERGLPVRVSFVGCGL